MWLNFMMINDAYIYWPVVLIGVTVIVLFLPVRTLYHHSRKWWAYSNVSSALVDIPQLKLTTHGSGDFCWLVYTPSSFVTSFSVICTARRRTPWA